MRLVLIQGNAFAVYEGRTQVAIFQSDGAHLLGAQWFESLRTADLSKPIEEIER